MLSGRGRKQALLMKGAFFAILIFLSAPAIFTNPYAGVNILDHVRGGGTALDFDGVNDLVDCGPATNLGISDRITMEAWVKGPTSQGQYPRIVYKGVWNQNNGFGFAFGGADVHFAFFATDGSWYGASSTTLNNIIDNTWHHIAGLYDGNALKFFVDGELVAENIIGPKSIASTGTNPLMIGSNWDGNFWRPYTGRIDEVRIFNAALDQSTIRAWMNRKITPDHPDYANLKGYWRMDEGEDITVTDLSGNGNHGTLTNMDQYTDWVASAAGIYNALEGGWSDTYKVVLTTQPSDTVTIDIAPDSQLGILSSTQLTFTTGNWDTPQTVEVAALTDVIEESTPHAGVISHSVTSADANYNGVYVNDVTLDIKDVCPDNDGDGVCNSEDNCPDISNPDQADSEAPDNLIAYWKLDEGSGSNAFDAANTYNGTIYGAAWTTGKVDDALSFDGFNDYVSTPLDIDQSGSMAYTFEAWVYPTSTNSGRHHVMGSDNGGHDWSLLREGAVWYVFTGNMSWSTEQSVDLNQWQHLAVVFDPGSGVKFYKNGGTPSSTSSIDFDSSDNNLNIGRNPGFGEYFAGIIDEAAVFDRALTNEEIQAHYQRTTGYLGDGAGAACDCNDNDSAFYPGAPEIPNDGIDQDCNGSDLVNDICADAIPVSDGTYSWTLEGSTNDGSATCGNSGGSPDVWFSYTAACDGLVYVNTCGTNDMGGQDTGIDTVLSAHSGCPGTTVNEHTCNDDWPDTNPTACSGSDSGVSRDSAIEVAVSTSEVVTIRATNYSAGVTGNFNLNISSYCYQDNDSDGYNESVDCNDNDPLEFPGQSWYKDVDGDLYSDGNSVVQCSRPVNYYIVSELAATSGDCNDNDNSIYPGATEIAADGIDQDCDGEDMCYNDLDHDNFGGIESGLRNDSDGDKDCSTGYWNAPNNTDCDDSDNKVYPGADEICDDKDSDCNPATVDGLDESWYHVGSTCGIGLCSGNTGQYECQSGIKVNTCDPQGGAQAEDFSSGSSCSDTVDNDCDGAVDGLDGGCYASQSETYEFERLWPASIVDNANYYDVAVGKNGIMYLVDYHNETVSMFTSDREFITKWGSFGSGDGEFYNASAVAVDPDGYVYVVDTGNDRIQKFSPSGDFVLQWGSRCHLAYGPPDPGCIDPDGSEGNDYELGDGQFFSPQDIEIDSAGNVYVLEWGNHRVQVFTTDGDFIAKWGSSGSDDGQFIAPLRLTSDSDGFIYISDAALLRIQKFSSDGTFVLKWTTKENDTGPAFAPWTIAIDNLGRIVTGGATFLQIYDSNGTFIGRVDGLVSNGLRGMDIDSNNIAYVGERWWAEHLFLKSDPPYGKYLGVWAQDLDKRVLQDPADLSMDAGGNTLFVVDSDEVLLFGADGLLSQTWNNTTHPGNIVKPQRVKVQTVGATEYIYIADDEVMPITPGINRFLLNGQFDLQVISSSPYDFAVDSSGNIYAIEGSNQDIVNIYNVSGALSVTLTADDLKPPLAGIAVDSSGSYVYLTSQGTHQVQKFSSSGILVHEWGSKCALSSGAGCVDPDGAGSQYDPGDGQFNYPEGITVDDGGFIYVADRSNSRIQKFTPDGQFLGKWGNFGYTPGLFHSPSRIHISKSTGKAFVIDSQHEQIQVFNPVSTGSNNKAIILAGGGKYEGNNLWEATLMNTNYAYRALTFQGFNKQRIYYFSEDNIDIDRDGQFDDIDDDTPTVAELGTAITSFAAGAENLVLYIADHGGTNNVRVSKTELLDGSTLNSWLNLLQDGDPEGAPEVPDITGKIIVIIDSCESGSFQSVLQGQNRVILTSTSPGEKAYFINQGAVSYSNFLWYGIMDGETVGSSHNKAKNALKDSLNTVILQTPVLYDEPAGSSASLRIGNGVDYHSTAPVVGSVSEDQNISGTSAAPITASGVTDPNSDKISRVWAVIMPPDFNLGDSDNAVQALPSIDLVPKLDINGGIITGEYEGNYTGFNKSGNYRIAVYARDVSGEASLPKVFTVSVGSPLRQKAIIVVGGEPTDSNRIAVESGAEAAYNALIAQGLTDSEIYYLSNSATSTGRDLDANYTNLSIAINNWPATDTHDMTIYLIGSGTSQSFQLSSTDSVTAGTLNGWLDNLQDNIGMTGRLTIVADFSYSGVFISQLPSSTAKGRILVGSSLGKVDFVSNDDISFSHYFWNKVLNGWTIRESFYYARSAMEFSTAQQQKAWIDDNGNGIGNESSDGALAGKYAIGVGIKLAGKDPLIGSVTAVPDTLTGGLSTLIRADDVTTVGTLASVWAVVTHPRGPAENAMVQSIVPMSNAGGNSYEGTTGDIFTDFGRYTVTVYAMDDDGNSSTVSQTTVSQQGLIDKYEDDDSASEAKGMYLDSAVAQQHNFHDSGDEDWVKFYGKAGEPYTFKATNLGTHSDAVMELYDTDGTTPLASWDNGGTADEIHPYTFSTDGIYYLKVSNNSGTYGNDTGYDLSVETESGDIFFGAVEGIARDTADAPLSGVVVTVGTQSSTATNSTGYYFVSLVMNAVAEDHTLSAVRADYTKTPESVTVTSDPWVWKEFQMTPSCSPTTEVCDGMDNDCDALIDDNDPDVTGQPVWYQDGDSDEYGNAAVSQGRCVQPGGYVADNTDCDDSDAGIYPGGPEVRIANPPASYYWINDPVDDLQRAYTDALTGETIQIKAGAVYTNDFSLNGAKAVTIEGGYNCSFTDNTGGTSSIRGNMDILDGSATIENVDIVP